MLKKRCEQCGGEYAARKNARFCSHECYGRWKSDNVRGENNPSWNGGKIVKTCDQCGGEYEIVPSQRDISRFCSRECMGEWRSENLRGENNSSWKGGKITKTCVQCGEEYKVNRHENNRRICCSKECQNKWQSENRCGENHPLWKDKTVKVCKQCGEEFQVSPSREGKRFCSRECKDRWHSGENNPVWKGGLSFEPYCHKFNEAFKESIREKHGRVCFLCPTTEEENGKKLAVHHTTYNKDCLCDDSDCEFVPLCVSCHSKTNFNRDYWEQMIMEKLGAIS